MYHASKNPPSGLSTFLLDFIEWPVKVSLMPYNLLYREEHNELNLNLSRKLLDVNFKIERFAAKLAGGAALVWLGWKLLKEGVPKAIKYLAGGGAKALLSIAVGAALPLAAGWAAKKGIDWIVEKAGYGYLLPNDNLCHVQLSFPGRPVCVAKNVLRTGALYSTMCSAYPSLFLCVACKRRLHHQKGNKKRALD